MQINLRKGLTIPLAGKPQQVIAGSKDVKYVALLGRDYVGLRPHMAVAQDEHVRLGQTLFEDKKNPGVKFTAPGTGIVTAINRGARRVLQSVVIRLEGNDEETFDAFAAADLPGLEREVVRDTLLASGLWTTLRTRPFSKVPQIGAVPSAIFVTAIDTNPLAADPVVVIDPMADDFVNGLHVIARLTEGKVYVCMAVGASIGIPENDQVERVEVAGPHPAGLVGTHIHFIQPVNENRAAWHLNYQDVIAIGKLLTEGRLWTQRVVSLAGSPVENPRLVTTRIGASTDELVADELSSAAVRVISGSILSGHHAQYAEAFLGRYHTQVSVLPESSERELLNWAMPGRKKYSAVRAFAGHLFHRRPFDLTTSQNGSPRAMVPIGSFERVMPLDILPAPLLKALMVEDTDSAQALGCLELDEEDLALCSFVCSGKYDYGTQLRNVLAQIEKLG